MVSYETFKSDLASTGYPLGDPLETYNRIQYYIHNVNIESGDPVTYDFIIKKFKQHLEWWNYLYRKKEEDGFLSKEAEKKRKTLYDFLGDNMFNQEFIIVRGNLTRDAYLFGNFTIKYLMRKMREFEEKLKRK